MKGLDVSELLVPQVSFTEIAHRIRQNRFKVDKVGIEIPDNGTKPRVVIFDEIPPSFTFGTIAMPEKMVLCSSNQVGKSAWLEAQKKSFTAADEALKKMTWAIYGLKISKKFPHKKKRMRKKINKRNQNLTLKGLHRLDLFKELNPHL